MPAIFIGVFYVVNRLLLPVNIGHIGPPTVREVALYFAFIMVVVQVLLLARGTVNAPAKEKVGAPDDTPRRRGVEAGVSIREAPNRDDAGPPVA